MPRRTLLVYARAGDLLVTVVAIVSMHLQAAPAWALTLAALVSTRASLLATAMDLGELQKNIRRTREESVPKTHALNMEEKRLPPP